MIYTQRFIDEIKDKQKILYFNGNKTELVTYCPFCEGITGKSHGHLYISIFKPVFICHRCGIKGNIISFLLEIKSNLKLEDCYDESLIKDEEENTNMCGDSTSHENIFEKINDISISRDVFLKKIDYLKMRIGVDHNKVLSIPRLVLQPSVILNNVNNMFFNNQYLKDIDENYIGFLSDDYNLLYMRSINENIERRHILYRINKNNSENLYSIQNCKIDCSVPVVILSEGVFDIIVPYYSGWCDRNINKKYNYLFSVFGKGNYHNSLYKIMMKIRVPLVDLIILSDNDVFPAYYKKIFLNVPFINSLIVYFNEKYKDFGNILNICHNNFIKVVIK